MTRLWLSGLVIAHSENAPGSNPGSSPGSNPGLERVGANVTVYKILNRSGCFFVFGGGAGTLSTFYGHVPACGAGELISTHDGIYCSLLAPRPYLRTVRTRPF